MAVYTLMTYQHTRCERSYMEIQRHKQRVIEKQTTESVVEGDLTARFESVTKYETICISSGLVVTVVDCSVWGPGPLVKAELYRCLLSQAFGTQSGENSSTTGA